MFVEKIINRRVWVTYAGDTISVRGVLLKDNATVASLPEITISPASPSDTVLYTPMIEANAAIIEVYDVDHPEEHSIVIFGDNREVEIQLEYANEIWRSYEVSLKGLGWSPMTILIGLGVIGIMLSTWGKRKLRRRK